MIATRPAAPVRRGLAVSTGSGVVLLVGLGGLALLALSVVPPSALAGRLLETAGEARSGPYTQDLYAHLGERLRLAGAVLLTGALLLVPLRATLSDMLRDALADLRVVAWPGTPRHSLELGALSVVALVVRLGFLGQPIRYDEAITYNEFASRPLYYGLSFYPEPNNHLLNTLLVHVTSGALGGEAWAVRLPALVAGVLLVPATYVLGWLLHGRAAGLLAAALVAASSYLTEYSTNARGYTLQALAFCVTFCLTVWATRRRSGTALLLAAVVATLGFWAVPTMLYGVAVIAGWLAAEALAGRARLGWSQVALVGLLVAILSFVLYVPVVVVSGPERLAANRFVEPLGGAELVRDLTTSLARAWSLWNRDLPWPAVLLLVVGVGLQSAQDLRQRRPPLAPLALGMCLGLVLVQRVAPFERVWLFVLPLYFVLASGGLLGLFTTFEVPRWAASTAAIGLACLLGTLVLRSGSILASRETGTFPDAAAVAETLRDRIGPDDAVATTLPASLPELQYYFRRDGLPLETLVRPPEQAQRVFVVGTVDPPNGVLEAHFVSANLYRVSAP